MFHDFFKETLKLLTLPKKSQQIFFPKQFHNVFRRKNSVFETVKMAGGYQKNIPFLRIHVSDMRTA